MRGDLPSGAVTFLFTDVEGSTQLLHAVGEAQYAWLLAEHRRALRTAFTAEGGVEVDTQGDAFLFAFGDAAAAVAAAAAGQVALAAGPIRVRMGLHTGRPVLTEEGYVGADLHLAARIAAAGHGGQVLLSAATRKHCTLEVSDLGEHRLKDFVATVQVFQLGGEAFPPLKTISNTNLPRPASSFVGRERELSQVVALLRQARLVTLTGAGGSGKTRLGIEAAAELVPEQKAGVFWVGLAALRDPALVLETVAQTLGAKGSLAEHVGERKLLLLLDNFEQVVEAAPRLSELLENCSNLTVLVTSRERLRLRGEVEYSVPPLNDQEAVELFSERAQLESDGVVRELCRRLDNLPLALELAAARTSVLTPAQILERLAKRLDVLKGGRDSEARQRTLRATIEWSYELLDEEERRLFARLAVFAGGCTLDSAEKVAGADLDVLQSLADKSLVRHNGERFWMLETIREFALARLDAKSDAADLRRRHADHYLALAEAAFPHIPREPHEWLPRVEAEHDNLRAVFDLAESNGDVQLAMQLAGALFQFWYIRGHLSEGRRRVLAALDGDGAPTPWRARALQAAAGLCTNTGDPQLGLEFARQALAMNERLGDAWGAAYAMLLMGMSAAEGGDFQEGIRATADSIERFRKLGDLHFQLVATDNLAYCKLELGDTVAARRLHESELPLARATGNQRIESMALGGLADLDLRDGEPANALRRLEQSVAILKRLDDLQMVARQLRRAARALAVLGLPERAAQVLGAAESMRRRVGANEWGTAQSEAEIRELLAPQLGVASLEAAVAAGAKLQVEEAVRVAFGELG